MEEMNQQNKAGRRILLFPTPFQGHVTPMRNLATVLYSIGFYITIIQTRYNSLDPNQFPCFIFHFLNDDLPANLMPFPSDDTPVLSALNTNCLEPFRDCLSQILCGAARANQEPVACLIADPMWSFAGSVSNSFNLPRIALRTGSLSSFVAYDSLPSLRKKGLLCLIPARLCFLYAGCIPEFDIYVISFKISETRLDEAVSELPPLKVKDIPPEVQHKLEAAIVKETKTSQGVICNTFKQLENSSIEKSSQILSIPIFPIGPVHRCSPPSAISLWRQDQSSIPWLNTRAPKSVLYVSFGSMVATSEAEFLEIAWGLVYSKQPFLWVVRPGMVQGSDPNGLLPDGYLDMVHERGHIVEWAPQLEVLAHPAVGGFWTHCGWNSVIESISEGVPMLCSPSFADQAMNARFVSDEWKIGLQLENGIERKQIERAIKKLMVDEQGEEMRKRITTLKEMANLCLMEGGSSYKSLENLTSFLSTC